MLLAQCGIIGVFLAKDALVFYFFWELALIPVYFLASMWGGEKRIQATFKFFVYTFAGSLLMLAGIIYVYLHTGERIFSENGIASLHSFAYQSFLSAALAENQQGWLFLLFFVAFAIKMPIFPFHTWQADTYSVAPSQGTMLLSGIMLKMGIFGLIRWMWPLTINACGCYKNIFNLYNVFIILAVIGIIYAAIIAITQNDLKRVIAWSSVSHVGLIAAGIMTWNKEGLQGGILQSFNHGINVIGLFFVAEIIERRLKTRNLNEMGGLAKSGKSLAILFMIVMLGSVAVPLTNGFTGEFLLLNATFNYQIVLGIVSGLTIIFCAVYMLRVYQLAMFGPEKEDGIKIGKLTWSEILTLSIIALIILVIGIFPNVILDISDATVNGVINQIKK